MQSPLYEIFPEVVYVPSSKMANTITMSIRLGVFQSVCIMLPTGSRLELYIILWSLDKTEEHAVVTDYKEASDSPRCIVIKTSNHTIAPYMDIPIVINVPFSFGVERSKASVYSVQSSRSVQLYKSSFWIMHPRLLMFSVYL